MMGEYILKRLAVMAPVLLCGSIITFSLVFLSPGDIGTMMADAEASAMGAMATPEMVEAIKEHYGLDDPIHVQYLKWLNNALHGDLGRSFSTHKPVFREFMDHLGPTLTLNLAGILIAILIAVPLGVISAVKKNTIVDHLCRVYVMMEISMPTFWLALMLLWFFALAISGVISIINVPSVWKAINPYYAIRFMYENGLAGFFVLSEVILCATGGEALYADMGHLGRKPIRNAWHFVFLDKG